MIGEFVTLVSHIDVYGNAFRQRMDELNYMMKDKKFPHNLRRRCRMYLLHSRQHHRQINYRQLEQSMSLSLRYEVAAANNAWITRVWYFRDIGAAFVVDLSQNSHSLVYAPTEVVEQALTLFVINNGIAARKGRIMTKWSVWGHDFLLDNLELVDMAFAAALSYLEVVGISRERMIKILEAPAFDCERRLVRRAVVFYTVKAHALRIGAEQLKLRKHGEPMRSSSYTDSPRSTVGSEEDLEKEKELAALRRRTTMEAAIRVSRRRMSDVTTIAAQSPPSLNLRDVHDRKGSNSIISSTSTLNQGEADSDEDSDLEDDDETAWRSGSTVVQNHVEMRKVLVKLRQLDSKTTIQHDRVLRIEQRLVSQIEDMKSKIQQLLDATHTDASDNDAAMTQTPTHSELMCGQSWRSRRRDATDE